jgi:hypothetical protein
MIWDDIRFTLVYVIGLLMILLLMPVALTGGFFVTEYIYCDVAKLCSEIKK